MAISSKIFIISCLLLNFLICQNQEHQVYALNQPQPETLGMARPPRSNNLGDPNPIRSSQMEMAKHPRSNNLADPNPIRSSQMEMAKHPRSNNLGVPNPIQNSQVEMAKYPRSNNLGDPNPIKSSPMVMVKHPRSNNLDLDLIRDSQMGIAVCPAENANDVRYENYPTSKLNHMRIVKDEDDGEDLDVAAGDDDEDSDDFNNSAVDEVIVDDSAFMARISCLMAALDHHIKSIVCNAKNIETQLASLKSTGICGNTIEDTQNKMKDSKKPKHFLDMHEQNEDDCKDSLGEKLGTGLPNTPINQQHHTLNKENMSPPGSGIHSQNRGDFSPPGPATHSRNRGDISPPGPGTHMLNREDATFHSGAEIESPKISEIKIIYPAPEHYNHKPYEEYETKLKRLMANRDAIEKNVYKMLAPKQGERM